MATTLMQNETWTSTLQESDWEKGPQGNLNDLIVLEFGGISEIERVYAKRSGDLFYIWIMVDRSNKELRYKIYSKQRVVMAALRDYGFDFYIIERFGERPEDLISGANLIFLR